MIAQDLYIIIYIKIDTQRIDVFPFLPLNINSGKNKHIFPLNIVEENNDYLLSYNVSISNQFKRACGEKNFSRKLPKHIITDNKTFEVMGLLQAEMSKTFNRPLTFCNSEAIIINKVIDWFDREFNFSYNNWKWYVKVNINEPLDKNYKKQVEDKVVNFWLENTKIDPINHYPKIVSYIKNTKNKRLREEDFGSLILEKRDIIFTQFIINLVEILSNNMVNYDKESIRMFMRGIIACEGTVEMNKISKAFRVHISAIKKKEKLIYYNCLKKLGIESKIYSKDKLIISEKENNLWLLRKNLMSLHPKKYAKFLEMMSLYQKNPINL